MKRRMTYFALAFSVALVAAYGGPAFAQAAADAAPAHDTTFTFNWGQYAAEAITAIGAAGVWIAGAAIGLLPGPAQWAAKTFKLDQVIGKSIAAAAHDLAGKITTKGFTVDVRSEMLATTLRNVERNAADLARKYASTIELKVKARIEEYIRDQVG